MSNLQLKYQVNSVWEVVVEFQLKLIWNIRMCIDECKSRMWWEWIGWCFCFHRTFNWTYAWKVSLYQHQHHEQCDVLIIATQKNFRLTSTSNTSSMLTLTSKSCKTKGRYMISFLSWTNTNIKWHLLGQNPIKFVLNILI